MRVGILGGTFDPIHAGHLDLATAAATAVGLDRIVLLPAHVPPHRDEPHASAAHRFAMTALAIADRPRCLLSDLELDVPGPSYTTATLDRLAAKGLDTTSLALVLGADAFAEIETWKGYPAILDRCRMVVVSRPGRPATTLRQTLPALADRMAAAGGPRAETAGIVLVDHLTADVSSTEIRRRLAGGEPIDGLVPDLVAAYIGRHGLYRPDSGWPPPMRPAS